MGGTRTRLIAVGLVWLLSCSPGSAPNSSGAAPGAPTGMTATPGDRRAIGNWTVPSATGTSPIQSYTVSASAGTPVTITVGNTSTATITGLTNGTSYAFTVVATNSAGSGPASAPSPPVVPFGPPAAPTNVAATAGNAQATVSWTPADSNGRPITGYTVTSSPGGFTVTTLAGTTTSAAVTGLTNGTSYTFTVVATNAAGNGATSQPSAAVVPSATAPPPMGPLRVSSTNSRYFVDPAGNPVWLTGSHTWDSFQDLSQQPTWPFPNLVDFTAYVQFLKSHNHNLTILWRKDLPTYFNWGAGGTWYIRQWPWKRTGPGNASDGLPRFDLNQFDDNDSVAHDSYFERLRSRALQLQQNGIYAIVQLFDGLQLHDNRNGGTADGYPFGDNGAGSYNNVQSIGDDHAWGSINASIANTSANIMPYQDAYVKKVVDTLHDLQNVLYEVSEEAPYDSGDPTKKGPDGRTWTEHMINLVRTYETAQGYTPHPVGYGAYQGPADLNLLSSSADWVAPAARVSSASNNGKVIINDSDHTYYGTMWTDSPIARRNYVWKNFCNAASVIFMDPYMIYWSGRNQCTNPLQGVCSADVSNAAAYPEDARVQMGYTRTWASKLNLLAMTPQGSLSSTGYCLAYDSANSGEYLVYAPSGGQFTVNLSHSPATLNVEWFDPATNTTTAGSPATVTGGSTQTFTTPASIASDAVLHLK